MHTSEILDALPSVAYKFRDGPYAPSPPRATRAPPARDRRASGTGGLPSGCAAGSTPHARARRARCSRFTSSSTRTLSSAHAAAPRGGASPPPLPHIFPPRVASWLARCAARRGARARPSRVRGRHIGDHTLSTLPKDARTVLQARAAALQARRAAGPCAARAARPPPAPPVLAHERRESRDPPGAAARSCATLQTRRCSRSSRAPSTTRSAKPLPRPAGSAATPTARCAPGAIAQLRPARCRGRCPPRARRHAGAIGAAARRRASRPAARTRTQVRSRVQVLCERMLAGKARKGVAERGAAEGARAESPTAPPEERAPSPVSGARAGHGGAAREGPWHGSWVAVARGGVVKLRAQGLRARRRVGRGAALAHGLLARGLAGAALVRGAVGGRARRFLGRAAVRADRSPTLPRLHPRPGWFTPLCELTRGG